MAQSTSLQLQSKTLLLPATDSKSISLASQALSNGKLVSFPTETVYGLGANALNADACLQIFKTKGRPLTDPLIVHVYSLEQGLDLIQPETQKIKETFEQLGKMFWPGPLTLVVKANLDRIPMLITADTGFVGIRVPNHPVAIQLLKESGLPIAAPSANKFGHVSPTKAEHVYHDFHQQDEVLILDGGSCSFGIESTVLKITESELVIIRKGGISQKNLESRLDQLTHQYTVTQLGQQSKPEHTKCEAPGQFLRHYSPDIVSYLFSGAYENEQLQLENSVMLDFGAQFISLKDKVRHYRDLSEAGDCTEAIHLVYDFLRWAETKTDCSHVLLPDLKALKQSDNEHLEALFDRLYRAASGKRA